MRQCGPLSGPARPVNACLSQPLDGHHEPLLFPSSHRPPLRCRDGAVPAGPGLLAGRAGPDTVSPLPPAALRGTLVVEQPPIIRLDGKPARLSPGARIRSTTNMLVMSAALVNQELTVNYLLEPNGMVHEAWILTPAEAAEKRPFAQP